MALSRDIDNFEELGHQHGQRGPIYTLAAGIVTHADNLGFLRIVDIQREIVPGERPVKGFGSETVQRDTSRCNLSLQLLQRLVADGIGKGIALDFQLFVFAEDCEHIPVILAHQLNQVRKGAVDAAFVNLKEPDE